MSINEGNTTPLSTEFMADPAFATAPTSPESSQASTDDVASEETGTMSSDEVSEKASEEGSESEEKSEDEATVVENGDEENKEFDLKEWAEDFFEREYREHQWSAGAHAPPSSLTDNNEWSGETLRALAPGEELLSESEGSGDEDEDEDTALHQWHSELGRDPAAVKEASLGQLQMAMDMDKEFSSGTGGPKPRPKSIVEKRGIGDRVERGRRRKWAAEMAKVNPGRYAPYPGRPARAPPRVSAADKARLLQRKK